MPSPPIFMCDMPEAYVIRNPIARKDHKCCECGGVIPRGEKYFQHSGIWNGEPDRFKMCVDCDALHKQLQPFADPDDGIPFGSLYEFVFQSDQTMMVRFIEIKRHRGADIREWMLQKVAHGV